MRKRLRRDGCAELEGKLARARIRFVATGRARRRSDHRYRIGSPSSREGRKPELLGVGNGATDRLDRVAVVPDKRGCDFPAEALSRLIWRAGTGQVVAMGGIEPPTSGL